MSMQDHESNKVLQQELETYQQKLPELLQRSKEHFVLIKGDTLFGTFVDFETAYRDGVARFGLEPFLVKQVVDPEPTQHIPLLMYNLHHARL